MSPALTATCSSLARLCARLAHELHRQGARRAVIRPAMAALLLDPCQAGGRGLLSISARAALGSRFVEAARSLAVGRRGGSRGMNASDDALRDRTRADPTNPWLHRELGLGYLAQGLVFEGYACLRTAATLAQLCDRTLPGLEAELQSAEQRLGMTGPTRTPSARTVARGDPTGRLRYLARQALDSGAGPSMRLLDAGGGQGSLAALLPDAEYVLAEPAVNGLDGVSLPFGDGAFDVVVCSHVLEHVPREQRPALVRELVRLARRLVLLLCPVAFPPGRSAADEAVLAITGATWAREHLEHGLPSIDELKSLFSGRGVELDLQPYSDARLMYWQYLAGHFAEQAGEAEAMEQAVALFQEQFDCRPAEPDSPHDVLVRAWLSRRP